MLILNSCKSFNWKWSWFLDSFCEMQLLLAVKVITICSVNAPKHAKAHFISFANLYSIDLKNLIWLLLTGDVVSRIAYAIQHQLRKKRERWIDYKWWQIWIYIRVNESERKKISAWLSKVLTGVDELLLFLTCKWCCFALSIFHVLYYLSGHFIFLIILKGDGHLTKRFNFPSLLQ